MPQLIDQQTKFISHLLGGSAEYIGRALTSTHKGLNIKEDHFEEVTEVLQERLENPGGSDEGVSIVIGVIAQTRSAIVVE